MNGLFIVFSLLLASVALARPPQGSDPAEPNPGLPCPSSGWGGFCGYATATGTGATEFEAMDAAQDEIQAGGEFCDPCEAGSPETCELHAWGDLTAGQGYQANTEQLPDRTWRCEMTAGSEAQCHQECLACP